MHSSVLEWVEKTITMDDVEGRNVLEVGSYNVNGSVRPIIEALNPASYLGVDQTEGPGVDFVCDATDLLAAGSSFGLVISTEMLEHVVDWRPVIVEMVDVLAPGGLLIITTRSKGFPYHPYPIDTWRYSISDMKAIAAACDLILHEVSPDPLVPGVFMSASKPYEWVAPWADGGGNLLDFIPVEPMIPE